MPRPRKLTIDYFPHFCVQKKTLFILQQTYGNDGYAFWFKLLEQLGATQGHYIDLRNNGTSEFLQAYTRCDGVSVDNMLTLLAKLGAIDPELWQIKVIWCQKLVENVADVYVRRQTELPARPSHLLDK